MDEEKAGGADHKPHSVGSKNCDLIAVILILHTYHQQSCFTKTKDPQHLMHKHLLVCATFYVRPRSALA